MSCAQKRAPNFRREQANAHKIKQRGHMLRVAAQKLIYDMMTNAT